MGQVLRYNITKNNRIFFAYRMIGSSVVEWLNRILHFI